MLQIGIGVHSAVGQIQQAGKSGHFIDHHMAEMASLPQALLLVHHRTHQIGGTQNALHQKVGFPLAHQFHGFPGTKHRVFFLHQRKLCRLSQLVQNRPDLFPVAHQNGLAQSVLCPLANRPQHILIVSRCHGQTAGRTAPGRLQKGIKCSDHSLFLPFLNNPEPAAHQ